MNIEVRAAELAERGRIEDVLFRVLPRVGNHMRVELVQRLAQELRKEGIVVRRPESERARARMREGR